MRFPSFEELAELVRTAARLTRNERVDPDSELHRDLKLDGRRAIEVLNAIEGHFGIHLSPEIHHQFENIPSGLSKGSDSSPVLQSLMGTAIREDHPWTVGRLYKAALEELNRTERQTLPHG